MDTSQRVALVTGASRGIGSGIVRRLRKEGVQVGFTYLQSKERAEALARETGALAIQANNGEEDAVRRAVDTTVERFGRLDILVNNAFTAVAWPIEDFPMEEFDWMLQVNLRGTWVATQEAVKHLGDGGRIINIGSIYADRLPSGDLLRSGLATYSMVKAGLAGMTRGLSRELGPKGITVNTVQPGLVLTDAIHPEVADHIVSLTPTGFGAEPVDIAHVVAYLASVESRFVNGATWDVDGGFAT